MKCPSCNGINKDDRNQCYNCNADLTVLRTVILKAKHHYNVALEHAERGRLDDAIADLKTAVSIYNDFPQAHNVLGTLYARMDKWDHAIAQWQQTLNLDPANKKAVDYLFKAKLTLEEPLLQKQNRLLKQILSALAIVLAIFLIRQYNIHVLDNQLQKAAALIQASDYNQAYAILNPVSKNHSSYIYQSKANELLDKIRQTLDKQVSRIRGSLERKEYEQGLGEVKEIRGHALPPEWKTTVDGLNGLLYSGLIEQEAVKANQMYDEKKDYWSAKKLLSRLDSDVLNQKEKDELTSKINQLKNKWIDQSYKSAVDYQQKKDFVKMNAVINDMLRESLDKTLSAKLIEMQKQPKKDNALQMYSNAQKLVEKKKYDEFLKLAPQIDSTYLTDSEKQWLSIEITKLKSTPQKSSKK